MNVFWVDLKKSVLSPKFVLSVLLMLLLCLLADAPIVSAREQLSILDEIIKHKSEVWIDTGVYFSSPAIFFRFDQSIWYSIILPVIASFSVIYNFFDEWCGDNYILTLSRCGYIKYSLGKLLSAFFTGALTALFGLFLFGFITAAVFPSLKIYTNSEEIYFDASYFNPLSAIIAKVINNVLLCGFYAVLSILLCLIIKDKFFTLCSLMVINYFSMKLEDKFENSKYFLKENNRVLKILFPDCQNELYSLFPNYCGISFYWYVPIIIFSCLAITFISYCIIKRRYKYAS